MRRLPSLNDRTLPQPHLVVSVSHAPSTIYLKLQAEVALLKKEEKNLKSCSVRCRQKKAGQGHENKRSFIIVYSVRVAANKTERF